MSGSIRLKLQAVLSTRSRGTWCTLRRKVLEPRRILGNCCLQMASSCVKAPMYSLLHPKGGSRVLHSAKRQRVTDDLICHPQTCAYGRRRSFCDLQRPVRLRYLAHFRVWQTGRVLNVSLSHSAASLASKTRWQKETAEFHELSFRNKAAIMLPSDRTPNQMAATRSRLSLPHAGHSASWFNFTLLIWNRFHLFIVSAYSERYGTNPLLLFSKLIVPSIV